MKTNIINQIEKYINILLMPLESHYYHQFEHAIDVKDRAIEIAKREGLSDEEIELVVIASLFHDTGFIIQYDNNEYIGAKIAQNYLKSILYPKEKIKIIERLILATKPDYKTPVDILEEVIKDADLDNLGRDDFFEKEHNLRSEVETIKRIKVKKKDWHHASLDLLNNYSYFTKSQKEERDNKKIENAKKLEEMIKDLEEKENI